MRETGSEKRAAVVLVCRALALHETHQGWECDCKLGRQHSSEFGGKRKTAYSEGL
jgi:hypothetical protein